MVLKLQPSEFWSLTPQEFEAVCAMHIKMQPGYSQPVSREEYEAMRARFPDGARTH